MTFTAKQRAQIDAHTKTQWSAFVAHVNEEKRTGNVHLEKAFELWPNADAYGWRFLNKFKLLAIVPAKEKSDYSYFALRGHGVAFFADESAELAHQRFVFDSEHTYLCGADGKAKDAYRAHIQENPCVLFFHGGDDGHVGMRFPDKASVVEFIELLDSFEDVFDFDKNPKAVHKALIHSAGIEEQRKELDMTLCYHN